MRKYSGHVRLETNMYRIGWQYRECITLPSTFDSKFSAGYLLVFMVNTEASRMSVAQTKPGSTYQVGARIFKYNIELIHGAKTATCCPANCLHARQCKHMQRMQPHAANATRCSQCNHIQPRQLHAANATKCRQSEHMQPRQPHAAKATTCSHVNHLQPRQRHAAKSITCS